MGRAVSRQQGIAGRHLGRLLTAGLPTRRRAPRFLRRCRFAYPQTSEWVPYRQPTSDPCCGPTPSASSWGCCCSLQAWSPLIYSALARRRAVSLIWLGVFVFLYGLRLLARADSFRLAFELSSAFWEFIAAVITYTVPIPDHAVHTGFVPAGGASRPSLAIGLVGFCGLCHCLGLHPAPSVFRQQHPTTSSRSVFSA